MKLVGNTIFHIPQEYENMLTIQQGLIDALNEQWPNTQFTVEYGALNTSTPYTIQSARKEKPFTEQLSYYSNSQLLRVS